MGEKKQLDLLTSPIIISTGIKRGKPYCLIFFINDIFDFYQKYPKYESKTLDKHIENVIKNHKLNIYNKNIYFLQLILQKQSSNKIKEILNNLMNYNNKFTIKIIDNDNNTLYNNYFYTFFENENVSLVVPMYKNNKNPDEHKKDYISQNQSTDVFIEVISNDNQNI